MSATEVVRPWRGVSAADRVGERRERLLAAGIEVFAERGFHAATVRDLCRAAGLTQRYFYESFADKEALLVAVAETIVADFLAAATPSVALIASDSDAAIDGAARAVIGSLTDDPRRARVLFVEIVGVSPELEERRRIVIGALADFICEAVAADVGDWARGSVEVQLLARAVVGAAQELVVAYVRDELPLDREGLVTNLKRLFLRTRPILTEMAKEHS